MKQCFLRKTYDVSLAKTRYNKTLVMLEIENVPLCKEFVLFVKSFSYQFYASSIKALKKKRQCKGEFMILKHFAA